MRRCRPQPDISEQNNQVWTFHRVLSVRPEHPHSLDLSWNYASESQAYDRVHRLGQEKEVFVKRLVVRDTIEERCVPLLLQVVDCEGVTDSCRMFRMLRLQETKTGLAEAALGEGTGVKLHKLSVKELKAVCCSLRTHLKPTQLMTLP